jgi:PIN domain nuclease of toxin-antitoxin system
MIMLDTHIWVWWLHDAPELPDEYRSIVEQHEGTGLGVSAISCWEVAKLVEKGRLLLPCPITEWMDQALTYPGIQLLPLTPQIAVTSTQLPQPFHRDPADQIIVATARLYQCPLVTMDTLIRAYPHVQLLPHP